MTTRSSLCTWALALGVFAGCAPRQPHVPPRDEARAADLAVSADRAFAAGRPEQAFQLATHALVVRLAACDGDCPEVARSFVQLGDFRCAQGQRAWADQSYRHAVEILTRAGDERAIGAVRAQMAKCGRSTEQSKDR